MIVIPAPLIRAAMLFMAKQDVRYYLNGICIEVTGEREFYIAATDGHRLFAARHEQKEPIAEALRKTFILDREGLTAIGARTESVVVEQLGDAVLVKEALLRINSKKKKSLVNVTAKRLFCPVVDGKFPHWRKVVVDALKAPDGHAEFNYRYLHDAARAQMILSGGMHEYCSFVAPIRKKDAACIIPFAGKFEALALVMQLRANGPYGLAPWALDLMKPEPAATPVTPAEPAKKPTTKKKKAA